MIQQELFQAGSLRVDQTQLGLAGGGSAAAFRDIFPAAARSLRHLIVRARTLVNEPVAKGHRAVVDDRGHLIGAQRAVTTARAEPPPSGAVPWV